MELKELENRVNDIQFQLDDLKNVREPMRANERINFMEYQLNELGTKIDEMNNRLNAYVKEDKFLELFTDEEFKNLYKSSGLGAKDVANLMKLNDKFKELDSTPQTINKIVNGERGSLELRSYLGKQFRFAITKRQNI